MSKINFFFKSYSINNQHIIRPLFIIALIIIDITMYTKVISIIKQSEKFTICKISTDLNYRYKKYQEDFLLTYHNENNISIVDTNSNYTYKSIRSASK